MDEKKSLQQSQAAKRKNLAEWRASRLHDLDDLPSGLPVTVKDISLQDMVMMDGVEIPNTLLDMMFDNDAKQAKGEEDALSDNEVILDMMRNKADFNKLLDEMTRTCLVSPQIGETADDEHITLDELPFADKMHIFNFLNREVAAVRPFPDEPDTETDAQPGGSLRTQAQPMAEFTD